MRSYVAVGLAAMLIGLGLPATAGGAAPDLTVVMRWETHGTDLDLAVTGPTGQRHSPVRDVLRGPGRETCIVKTPLPGSYRIAVVYFDSRGGQITPASVEVRLGDKPLGTHKLVLTRQRESRPVTTVIVPSPDDALRVRLEWKTQGTDVDLVVLAPNGRAVAVDNDCASGPGQETCLVPAPVPGQYRILAHYFDDKGGQATAVAAEVRRGGKVVGTYKAELTRRGQTQLLHTYAMALPEGTLTVEMSWQTRGTDLDLLVFGPDGRRHPPVRDILRGPGKEVCIIPNARPEDYRIQVLYYDDRGGVKTPVKVEVRRGAKVHDTYDFVLTRRGERRTVGRQPKGEVTVVLKWQTRGTDVDLRIFDPNGKGVAPLNDDVSGPGEETCVIPKLLPGSYRVMAWYANDRGRQRTPIVVEIHRGGKLEKTYTATLTRRGERMHLCSIQGPKANPGRALTIDLSWQTHGTDIDLYVLGPDGARIPVRHDVLRGPGKETCVIADPAPGNYRIEALYYDTAGGQQTPVTVEVRRGGTLEGTHRATLTQLRQRLLIHTYTLKSAPRGQ